MARQLSRWRARNGLTPAIALAAVLLSGLLAACGSTSTTVAPSPTDKCGVTVTTTVQTVDAAGGQGQVSVSTGRECSWAAASAASWITLKGSTQGQGAGSVDFSVARNSDPVPRTGSVTVSDQRISITQRGGTCTYDLSLNSLLVPAKGGARDVEVRASSSACEWKAESRESWIGIKAGASGSGNGRVTFEVAPTSGPPRTGSLVIADRTVTVTQADGCSYAVAPSTVSVPAGPTTAAVNVTSAPGCPWAANSTTSWIAIDSGAGGAGSGTTRLAIAANDGPARSASITVAGRSVTVSQASACTYAVSPTSLAFIYQGQTREVVVTANAGCSWTATSQAPWLSVGPASGSGSVVVAITAERNNGPARTGSVTVAEQTVTASQLSGCHIKLSDDSASFGPKGGSGKFRVYTEDGCRWQVKIVGGQGWVTVTRGDDGNGNGPVEYKVAPNWGAPRSAQLVIEDAVFTITQSGS